jgi:hypothetical protein
VVALVSLKGAFGAFEARLECPLRDQLARYFAGEMKMPPDKAMLRANEFMRIYLEHVDENRIGRVDDVQSRRIRTREHRRSSLR